MAGQPDCDVVEHLRKNWVMVRDFSNLLGGHWQGFNLMVVKNDGSGNGVI